MNLFSHLSTKSKRNSILFAEVSSSSSIQQAKKDTTNNSKSYSAGNSKITRKPDDDDDSQGKYGIRKPKRDAGKKRHSMIIESEVVIPKSLQNNKLETFTEEETLSVIPKKYPELKLPSADTDFNLKDSNVFQSDAFIMVKDNSFSGCIDSTDLFNHQLQDENVSDDKLHNISPLKSKCHRTSLYFN